MLLAKSLAIMKQMNCLLFLVRDNFSKFRGHSVHFHKSFTCPDQHILSQLLVWCKSSKWIALVRKIDFVNAVSRTSNRMHHSMILILTALAVWHFLLLNKVNDVCFTGKLLFDEAVGWPFLHLYSTVSQINLYNGISFGVCFFIICLNGSKIRELIGKFKEKLTK